jgi:hypothetical protein
MAMGPLYLIPLHESAVGVQPFGKKKENTKVDVLFSATTT